MKEQVKKFLNRLLIVLAAIGSFILYFIVKKRMLPTLAAQKLLQFMLPEGAKDHFTQGMIDEMFIDHAGQVEAMTRQLEKEEVDSIKSKFHEAFGKSI